MNAVKTFLEAAAFSCFVAATSLALSVIYSMLITGRSFDILNFIPIVILSGGTWGLIWRRFND